MATLGRFCGHYWHVRAALGALWVTLGLLLEHLRHVGGACGGHFEVILGSVWGQFGYLWAHTREYALTLSLALSCSSVGKAGVCCKSST